MFFRSLFYERTILGHLERVEQLPPDVQAEIAMRVRNLIELARPVSDALLERFAQMVREEQLLAVQQGVTSDMDPLWAAPNARLVATGNPDRQSAAAIIAAVETFTRAKHQPRRTSVRR